MHSLGFWKRNNNKEISQDQDHRAFQIELFFQEVVDYDKLNDMKFLDCCIQETLRLYPAAPRYDEMSISSNKREQRPKRGKVRETKKCYFLPEWTGRWLRTSRSRGFIFRRDRWSYGVRLPCTDWRNTFLSQTSSGQKGENVNILKRLLKTKPSNMFCLVELCVRTNKKFFVTGFKRRRLDTWTPTTICPSVQDQEPVWGTVSLWWSWRLQQHISSEILSSNNATKPM